MILKIQCDKHEVPLEGIGGHDAPFLIPWGDHVNDPDIRSMWEVDLSDVRCPKEWVWDPDKNDEVTEAEGRDECVGSWSVKVVPSD